MSRRGAVLLLATVLFGWFLWGHDLWAPDEPYFGEGAREMVVDGHWLVPHVNGTVTTDKPPLFFWLIALLSLPFGQVLELTARLPSVLAAIGTVALTMRLGRSFYGERTAALAGVMLATSYMFWDKARWSQIDSLLCFLVWLALSAFAAHRGGDAAGRRAGLLFWGAAALATLAKGPVGLLLPLGAALLILAADRDLGRWRSFAPLLGPLLFIGVTGSWAVLATVAGPEDYSVWGALREHFVDRGLHGMHHLRPFWYYLERLPISLVPFSGLLPGAVLLAWRRRLPADRLLLLSALFVVLLFSISAEKRDLYVLPAFPALALLMASLVATVAGWREPTTGAAMSPRWATLGQAVGGVALVVLGVGLPLLADRLRPAPIWIVLLISGALIIGGLVTLVAAARGRPLAAVLASAGAMAIAYLLVTALLFPALDPVKSGRRFALTIRDLTERSRAQGVPVLAWRLGNLPETFAFYSNGVYTVETEDPAAVVRHLQRDAEALAVVNGDQLDLLPAAALEGTTVVARAYLSRRVVLVLSNRPYPESAM